MIKAFEDVQVGDDVEDCDGNVSECIATTRIYTEAMDYDDTGMLAACVEDEADRQWAGQCGMLVVQYPGEDYTCVWIYDQDGSYGGAHVNA